MNEQLKPTLLEILKTLNHGEENDIAFITAATMNLYAESRKRLFGQVLIGREDVKAILAMVDTLLTDRQTEHDHAISRSRALTVDEEAQVLKGLGDQMGRRV